ncbi:MAG: hypothetical protein LLG01_17415 [Planctomycetaceae bacterium]|nr:hypothetical protein [Planctomycetaceae bacterium]
MQLLCGKCGRTTEADDNIAAKAVACAHCGRRIAIPFAGDEDDIVLADDAPEPAAAEAEGEEDFAGLARKMISRKIVVACGSCGRSLKASVRMVGRKVRCPACKARIKVPAPQEELPVLTVRARRSGEELPPLEDEDLEGLPVAKLVHPPVPTWVYFVAAVALGGAAAVGLLFYLAN